MFHEVADEYFAIELQLHEQGFYGVERCARDHPDNFQFGLLNECPPGVQWRPRKPSPRKLNPMTQ